MNSEEIIEIINKCDLLKKVFRGIFARDTLPVRLYSNKHSSAYIINLDKHSGYGTHWVAIYIPRRKDYIEYFDSTGEVPYYDSILQFVSKRKHFIYNNLRLQSYMATTCGQYCLFFLCSRVHGLKPDEILSLFKSDDFIFNDYFVNRAINGIFNTDLEVYNIDFLQNIFNRNIQS